ncbi:MAG: hypothetical protein HC803_03475 [Saprospiraceae bacterium]|nr:hypothetical protein [Saprospiraceae bacterium]
MSGEPRAVQQNKYLIDMAKEMYIYLSDNNSMHFYRDLNEVEYQNHANMLKNNNLNF